MPCTPHVSGIRGHTPAGALQQPHRKGSGCRLSAIRAAPAVLGTAICAVLCRFVVGVRKAGPGAIQLPAILAGICVVQVSGDAY